MVYRPIFNQVLHLEPESTGCLSLQAITCLLVNDLPAIYLPLSNPSENTSLPAIHPFHHNKSTGYSNLENI
jgi:hypothetical protein